jgi:hypothetical protein
MERCLPMPRYVAGRRPRAAAPIVHTYVGRLASAEFDDDALTIDHHGRDNAALGTPQHRRVPLGAIEDVELSADRYGLPLLLVHLRNHERTTPAGFLHRNAFVLDRAVPADAFAQSLKRASAAALPVESFEANADRPPRTVGVPRDTPLLDWLAGG